ncbi:MAG: carboxypeptidase regulatory-like domain-containing protein, partial [Acidobacteriaceae bacterium]
MSAVVNIKKVVTGLFAIAVVALLSSVWTPLNAQSVSTFDTGTINGTITDSTGAAIPNATVTVLNTGTGFKKTVTSNGAGNFSAAALPFGEYTVTASAAAFSATTTKPLTLSVGSTVNVNLALAVAGGKTTVNVTGTSTSVNTTSPTSGTTLNATQIRNLPINGRDITDFLEIAPGSVNSIGPFQGSVNGQENFFTGLDITLDGQNASRGDVNGFSETEGNEQARLTRGSVDSVQEINFANSGYSAEVGHSLGPQMNIVTRGGTNSYHGTLFEYFRNDALDARDYFARGPLGKQPLRMNQFGGNLGGPIVHDRLFFFVNYEGIRQKTTAINSLYEIPSAYVRSQFVPSMQPVLAQMAPLPAGCTAIPAPASCAVPDTTDTGNPAAGADLVYDPAALPTTLREDSGAVRVDYNIAPSDRMFVRYSIDDSLTTQTTGLNQGQVTPLYLKTQYAMVHENHTFGPTLLNEASVALNRFYSDTNSNTPTPLTQFGGFFTNLGALPGAMSFNQITPFSVFEILDNVTKTMGANTLKMGVQLRFNRNDEWLRSLQSYQFGSFSDLENNNPFVLQKIGFPNFVGVRNSNWDFYVQDDWRVNRKLVVNLGLRYGYSTPWTERNNNLQNFDYGTQSFLSANKAPYSAPKGDIAPRIGLSYDPFGTGKTVIHAYYGLFYNPMHFGFNLVTNVPAYQSYSVNVFQLAPGQSIAYPATNPALPAGTANVYIFPQNPKDPISPNWLFGVQQQFGPNTVFTLNYTGNQDHHMQAGVDFAAVNLNPGDYVFQTRKLSGYANEYYDGDILNSSYNALQVQLRHNARNLNLEANYTWSHEIDDMVNVFSGFSNPYDPNFDRGPGDWDIRHNFTASAVYQMPKLEGYNGLERGVLGGWQTSSIFQVRSGPPVNVSIESGFFGLPARPDTTGQPVLAPGGVDWPNRSYNQAAYQIEPNFNAIPGDPSTIGNVGRNSLRGPGFFQWDFAGMKNFPLGEKAKLQFRADIFNILNHPNFAGPDGGICTAFNIFTSPASCTPNTNFGKTGQTIASESNSLVGT